jgi:hypothetical protein
MALGLMICVKVSYSSLLSITQIPICNITPYPYLICILDSFTLTLAAKSQQILDLLFNLSLYTFKHYLYLFFLKFRTKTTNHY